MALIMIMIIVPLVVVGWYFESYRTKQATHIYQQVLNASTRYYLTNLNLFEGFYHTDHLPDVRKMIYSFKRLKLCELLPVKEFNEIKGFVIDKSIL